MEEEKPKVKKKTAAKPKTVKGKVVVEEELGVIIIGTGNRKRPDKEDTKPNHKVDLDGHSPREELRAAQKSVCQFL